jgi:hypothetical protein
MMEHEATCVCGAAMPPREQSPIASFSEIRAGCPALRKVLLPDSIWNEFQDWCNQLDDIAERSVLHEAYRCGCLGRVTSPIHRYLLESGTVRTNVRKQYVTDLQETWLREREPLKRHRQWKIFYGRLAELLLAAWLTEQSYTISDLEVLREGSSDIEAVSPAGLKSAFEVKFIGSEASDFEMQVKSLVGKPSLYSVSPYRAINYLTFLVYTAAKQLQRASTNRTAILIVDEVAWWRFEPQLGNRWIDWTHPEFKFVGMDDGEWKPFTSHKHPGLPDDLAKTIRAIDSIWIVRQSSDFRFSLKYDIRIREGEV